MHCHVAIMMIIISILLKKTNYKAVLSAQHRNEQESKVVSKVNTMKYLKHYLFIELLSQDLYYEYHWYQ